MKIVLIVFAMCLGLCYSAAVDTSYQDFLKQVEVQRAEFNRRIQQHQASSGIINTGGLGDAPDTFGPINNFDFAPNPNNNFGSSLGNDPNLKTFGHAYSTFSESTNNNGVQTHKSGGAGIINDNGKVTKFDFGKV